jgi:hypothetical protein
MRQINFFNKFGDLIICVGVFCVFFDFYIYKKLNFYKLEKNNNKNNIIIFLFQDFKLSCIHLAGLIVIYFVNTNYIKDFPISLYYVLLILYTMWNIMVAMIFYGIFSKDRFKVDRPAYYNSIYIPILVYAIFGYYYFYVL